MSYQAPLALRWNRLACDAIYYTKTPPTIAARALAMVHTAMYDAWTAYCGTQEVSTTTGARMKRPAGTKSSCLLLLVSVCDAKRAVSKSLTLSCPLNLGLQT